MRKSDGNSMSIPFLGTRVLKSAQCHEVLLPRPRSIYLDATQPSGFTPGSCRKGGTKSLDRKAMLGSYILSLSGSFNKLWRCISVSS